MMLFRVVGILFFSFVGVAQVPFSQLDEDSLRVLTDQFIYDSGRIGVGTSNLQVPFQVSGVSIIDNPQFGVLLSPSSYIDWGNGNIQRVVVSGDFFHLTFVEPPGATTLLLILEHDHEAEVSSVVFPSDIRWIEGETPLLSSHHLAVDIVSVFYDGDYYYAQANADFR